MKHMGLMPQIEGPVPAQLDGHARLWAIFDRFAQDDRPAYRLPGGVLSFAQLHRAVLRLLNVLAKLPRRAERRPILIWGHKDSRYPVAYWACLLAGHPLVPIEPETPIARLQQVLESCDASVILLADGQLDALDELTVGPQFCVQPLPDPKMACPEDAVPFVRDCGIRVEDTAYIMFSSGTLGQPKGIQVTYANLLDFISWLDVLFADPDAVQSVSGTIRHCFDVSLFELWMSWTRKLPLSALEHGSFADSTGYIVRLAADRVSLWVSTPSMVRLFLKNRRFNGQSLPDLSTFLFCGEALTKPVVAALFERFPQCRVINTYGPTECTVAVTSVEITPAHLSAAQELPIGRPRLGTTLEFVSNPTLPGQEQGEILISGASVGAGYVGMPEKNAQAFLRPDAYRSGDCGSRGADGQWYFQGRMDREVKIQGYRVDLNEVEAQIRQQPGVEDVAVQPYVLHGEARALTAYVVGAQSDACLARLAQALSADLPPYLVPRYWIGGFAIGLNQNSKLDRTRLTDAAATLRHVHMPAQVQPDSSRQEKTQ